MWRNDTKCKYMFMFPLKKLVCKGLNQQNWLAWEPSEPLKQLKVWGQMSWKNCELEATDFQIDSFVRFCWHCHKLKVSYFHFLAWQAVNITVNKINMLWVRYIFPCAHIIIMMCSEIFCDVFSRACETQSQSVEIFFFVINGSILVCNK